MAQVSFPFADSDQPDKNAVTESRWSLLASNFADDCVIGPYAPDDTTPGSQTGFPGDETLKVASSANEDWRLTVQSGTAVVRGFYYQNTAIETVDLTDLGQGLPTGMKQIVTVVLYLDLEQKQITVDKVPGQASTSPKPPELNQSRDGNWAMPLADVELTAGQPRSFGINDRRMYRLANFTSVADKSSILNPDPGSFSYEAGGSTGVERLWHRGLNEWSLVMELGKYRELPNTSVPLIVNGGGALPDSLRRNFNCRMRYKWISPTTVTFSLVIENTSNKVMALPNGLGFKLPAGHLENMNQVFTAVLKQVNGTPDYGNWNTGAAWCYDTGSKNAYFIFPRKNSGIDNDLIYNFPPKGILATTGVYETNYLG